MSEAYRGKNGEPVDSVIVITSFFRWSLPPPSSPSFPSKTSRQEQLRRKRAGEHPRPFVHTPVCAQGRERQPRLDRPTEKELRQPMDAVKPRCASICRWVSRRRVGRGETISPPLYEPVGVRLPSYFKVLLASLSCQWKERGDFRKMVYGGGGRSALALCARAHVCACASQGKRARCRRNASLFLTKTRHTHTYVFHCCCC